MAEWFVKPNSAAMVPTAPVDRPLKTASALGAHRGTLAGVAARAADAAETVAASPIAGTSAPAQAIVTMAAWRLNIKVGMFAMHSSQL